MVITSFHPSPMGGSERQAFHLARSLHERGLDVSVVALGARHHPAEEIIDGIRIWRIRSALNPGSFTRKKTGRAPSAKIEYEPNDLQNFALIKRKSVFSLALYFIFYFNALRLISRRKIKFDILYIPIMEWTAYIGVLLGKTLGKKVVIKDSTMNGITNLLRYPFGSHMQKVIKEHGHFVAMTKIIRQNLLKAGVSPNKIFMIPNGVHLPDLPPVRNTIANKFVFVGNLYQQPAKGVDILLKAWKIVVASKPDATLFIIGDGDIDAYVEHTQKLGISAHVHFLGKQDNIQAHLVDANAFILPSRREGMSNALLEAMALGIPAIATDISGSQDLIEHNISGLLVPVEDAFSLAAAIIYLCAHHDHARAMGEQARRTIERTFTIDKVSERYHALFESLIQSRSPHK